MTRRLPDPASYRILDDELPTYLSELMRSIEGAISEVSEAQDTRYVLPSFSVSTVSDDYNIGKKAVVLVDASFQEITVTLPDPADYYRNAFTIKKIGSSNNLVTINEINGPGPDGRELQFGGPGDYATVISDGKNWHIKESNRMTGNARYADVTGLYPIDMVADMYIISSFGGAVTAQLPNASEALGRVITIKKTDPSANAVTVTEENGPGPDNGSVVLSTQNHAVTVMSNSVQWYVISKLQ